LSEGLCLVVVVVVVDAEEEEEEEQDGVVREVMRAFVHSLSIHVGGLR
jgi:hypothetical protein